MESHITLFHGPESIDVTVLFSYSDLHRIYLDLIDQALLEDDKQTPADMLLLLERLARRIQQKKI